MSEEVVAGRTADKPIQSIVHNQHRLTDYDLQTMVGLV